MKSMSFDFTSMLLMVEGLMSRFIVVDWFSYYVTFIATLLLNRRDDQVDNEACSKILSST